MERQHAINVYRCRKCGGEIVTVNLDAGCTPMFLRCRANPLAECDGTMCSQMYAVPQDLIPTHGWHSPQGKERERLDPAMQDHVKQGGLMIRKLDNLERERFGFRVRRA